MMAEHADLTEALTGANPVVAELQRLLREAAETVRRERAYSAMLEAMVAMFLPGWAEPADFDFENLGTSPQGLVTPPKRAVLDAARAALEDNTQTTNTQEEDNDRPNDGTGS